MARRILRVCALSALISCGAAQTVAAGSLTVAWDANVEADVVGYIVHYGTQPGIHTWQVDVGRVVQWTCPNLVDGQRYYFAVQAYNAAGLKSGLSSEVSGVVPIVIDITPPTVTSVAPPPGAAAVAPTVVVSVAFSEALNPSTVTAATVRLLDATGVAQGASLAYDATSRTIRLTPAAPLAFQQLWTVVVSGGPTGIRDAAGNAMAKDYMSTFTTTDRGLIAAFGFEELTGSNASDASGKSHVGTLSGASRTSAGRFGRALSFDGVDDWVTVPDSAFLDATSALTMEAWVRPTALGGWRSVLLKETAGGLAYSLYADDNAPWPATYINVGGFQAVTGTAPVALNAWTHLAVTYDGATIALYVNGALAGSRSMSGPIATSAAPLRIGGNAVWGEYFSGLIDEVRIYNRALSPAEIQADMSTAVASPEAGDTTPPTVAVISPATATTVSGTVVLVASAADDRGVAGVRFDVDGAPVGSGIAAPPYQLVWDSRSVGDGVHGVIALAWDAAGNTSASQSVYLTVANDTIAPVVTAVSPPAGAQNVPGGARVTAVFSEPLDPASIDAGTFELRDARGDVVAASVTYDVATATATLTPLTDLAAGEMCTATVRGGPAGVRDAAGNPLAADVAWSFTVGTVRGPVAAFGFDEGSGTAAKDASQNGHNGAITGALWRAGRFGRALLFDGVDDWVTIADAPGLDFTTGMTLEAWVYPTALGGWRNVLMKESAGCLSYSLYADDNDPRPAAYVDAGGYQSASGTSRLPLNTWTHLAVSYDGATLRLYVNGALVGSKAAPGPIATSAGALRIGGNAIWGEFFQGRIDEVRLYDRRLTQAEIQTDMATPVTGWIVAAYGFDDGTGTKAKDSAGRGLTGTITGAGWTTGRFGGGLSFDGIDDWVTVGDHAWLDLTRELTLEAWVKPRGQARRRNVIMKEAAGALSYALYASEDGSRPAGYVFTTQYGSVLGPGPIAADSWTHLATTYDGAEIRLYVNGVLISSQPASGNAAVSANPLRIGGNGIWGEFFGGVIDEVRIYYHALTESEIKTDMTTPINPG